MAQRILRPMNYGDILDELFDLYKKNFMLFAGISGIVYVPMYLLMYGAMGALTYSSTGKNPDALAIGMVVAMGAIMLLFIPLSFAVMSASTWAVSQTFLGNKPTILSSYKAIFSKLLPFALTMLLMSLLMMAGFLLCIVPGVIFLFWTAFASEVFVIEGLSYVDVINRSRQIAAGEWLRIFVLGLIVVALSYVVQLILTMPAQLLMAFAGTNPSLMGVSMVIIGVAQGIAQALVSPLMTIAFVLLYYDIRVRKEGFDIELLAASMGASQESTEKPTEPTV